MKIFAILIVALNMALLSNAASKDPTKQPGSGNDAFDNPLGGIQMPVIKQNGRTFNVNDVGFGSEFAAHIQQCQVQRDDCAAAVGKNPAITNVSDCDGQQQTCRNGAPIYG